MQYINNSLNDPFGSQLLITLDKLEPKHLNFNVNTRIDIISEQNEQDEYLPLIYFKNRWLKDQLEVKEMMLYENKQQVTSSVILTGQQK